MRKVLDRMKNEDLLDYKTLKIDNVCVAVSGGVDSMVLLHILKENFPKLNLSILHVNHGLRKESVKEEKFLRKYAEELGYPIYTKTVDVPTRMKESKISLEMAARELRYEFFEEMMVKLDSSYLFLGHHADDLLETMLMREVSGSSNEGLIAIRYLTDKVNYSIVRPLLPLDKSDLYDYAEEHNLMFFEDESNKDNSILRNRYRNKIIPMLKEENPNLTKIFASRSAQLAEDEDFFNEYVEEFKAYYVEDFFNKGYQISLVMFEGLRPSVRRRVLKSILKDLNPSISYPTNALEQLTEKFNTENLSDYIPLFGNVLFVKGYNMFYLLREEITISDYESRLNKHFTDEDFEYKQIADLESFRHWNKTITAKKFWFNNKVSKAFRPVFTGLFNGDKLIRFLP